MPRHGYRLGLKAEKEVILYFQERGYSLLAHRLRTPYGELDLIFEGQGSLLFVEVKARTSFCEAKIHSIIAPSQLRRLCRAAAYFIDSNENFARHTASLDLVIWQGRSLVRHLPNLSADLHFLEAP